MTKPVFNNRAQLNAREKIQITKLINLLNAHALEGKKITVSRRITAMYLIDQAIGRACETVESTTTLVTKQPMEMTDDELRERVVTLLDKFKAKPTKQQA